MEYIEKKIQGKPLPPEANEMQKNMEKMGKLPGFIIKWLFKRNIDKIRSGMGGDSRDITRHPISIVDKTIPGYRNPIGIRIYTPPKPIVRPLLMFYHGGGWIGGSVDAVEEFCKGVSDQADCVVISVDYHLAPEHPFPEGLEDSYSAIKWAVSHQDELLINLKQIIVGGDSAGGNFAAVICHLAKERDEFSISKQILIYPATDLAESDDSSDSASMPRKIANAFYSLYTKRNVDTTHYKISPINAPNFKNLPKALIAVGNKDGLYSSSLKYAKKLESAGNQVKFILYKGAFHAFIDDTGNSEQANDFVAETAKFIRE